MTISRRDAPTTTPEPGMARQVAAFSPHLMLVRHLLSKGWVGAAHSHPHHQIVYVVKGSIAFTADGETQTLVAGDSVAVDGGITHQATAIEDTEILDFFTPVRDDYKP